jgi:hypothetical protein
MMVKFVQENQYAVSIQALTNTPGTESMQLGSLFFSTPKE